ncbi:MAG: aminotransferase class III-fold pyridoxal phosphate-dependent enzyme, partial [Saprospiraceae bacterium]|nr:aminotransferase class III-fold pyridoxal phosphate-dependent enzyme [Saprospiraceae bacterium]
TIRPGEHGSTFGDNPLACAVAMESLQVILDEKLSENAHAMGNIFRHGLQEMSTKHALLESVRGKGLLNAIVIRSDEESETAWNLCMAFSRRGLLAKPTHGNKIRLAPPLVINEAQVRESLSIIEDALWECTNTQES